MNRPRLELEVLEDRTLPAGLNLLAVGVEVGAPHVRVLDAATGQERLSFYAFDPNFLGGVRVATGDVNGDGVVDIIAGAGAGGGSHVKVFSGVDGGILFSFLAYGPEFTGGVNVAAGDINNDGLADIITGAASGGSAHVKVFSGATGDEVRSFFAYLPEFQGGVCVATGDVNGDNRADIITGAGPGGSAHVQVFDGTNNRVLQSFIAFAPGFGGGVFVAAGDVNGDGRDDLIAGSGAGGGPQVCVYDALTGQLIASEYVFDQSMQAGVHVAVCYANGDGLADVVVACGSGGSSKTRILNGQTLQSEQEFNAFVDGYFGGVSVGANSQADADEVLDWNRATLSAIRTTGLPPPRASRLLAMVHAAVYDAVNGVAGGHASYLNAPPAAPAGASAEAAATAAAYRVLTNQLPALKPQFDRLYNATLSLIPEPARSLGVAYGTAIADQLLALRATDGSTTPAVYMPGTNPGEWRPTPPANAPALLPNWPNLTPFTMTSGDQFRPINPPDLTSAQYATDFEEVKQFGRNTSAVRTADQTEIALFWADGAGTVTPPGHWNQIAGDVAQRAGNTLAQNARLFAALNLALADAAIVSWDAKYFFVNGKGLWRPITAIAQADVDGNAATTQDVNWRPLIATPPFPSYTSGHSTFSSAAAAVLTNYFGNTTFVTYTDALPDVARTFTTFAAAAAEAGQSRIYGGIHFQFDNTEGLRTGKLLGNYVATNFLQ